MAEAITYCDRCARMIRPGESARGVPLQAGGVTLCPSCLEGLPPEERRAFEQAAGRARPPSGARIPRASGLRAAQPAAASGRAAPQSGTSGRHRRPPTTIARRADPRAGTAGSATLVKFAVGALAGIAVPVVIVLLMRGDAPRQDVPRPLPGPEPVAPPNAREAALRREEPAQEAAAPVPAARDPVTATDPLAGRLDALRARAARSLDDYDGISRDLATLIEEAGGRPIAAEAKALLERIDADYDKAVEAAFEDARGMADEFARRGDFAAAASGLRSIEPRFGGSRWLRETGVAKIEAELARVDAAQKEAAKNLVRNPGFEAGSDGWDDWGNAPVLDEEVRSGRRALRIGPGQGGRGHTVASVRPGDRIAFSVWAKVSKEGEDAWVGVDFFDAANTKDSRGLKVEGAAGAYVELSQVLTVPANMAHTAVWAWKNDSVGGYLFVDDYLLEKVED